MVPAICSWGKGGTEPPGPTLGLVDFACGCTRLNVAVSLGALRTGVWVLSLGKTPIWRLGV